MSTDFPGYPENIYDYDNQFDYQVWTPGTEIMMCNVPWDSAYKDVVSFESSLDRDEYFSSLSNNVYTISLKGFVYLKINEPIRVNVPFNVANKCNYIVVENPRQKLSPNNPFDKNPFNGPDKFYYFIKDVSYIAPGTTQLNVQLDVWQTFLFSISYGKCYVERGHVAMANVNCTIDTIDEYLLEPEGLNMGDEYDITSIAWQELVTDLGCYILVMSTTDLEADFGSVSSPNMKSAKGDIYAGLPSGQNVYLFRYDYFADLMAKLSSAPWVSQGITYISVIPTKMISSVTLEGAMVQGIPCYKITSECPSVVYFNLPFNFFSKIDIPEPYNRLLKFYTSPYTLCEMTANCGGEIVLKPECLVKQANENDFTIGMYVSITPPDVRMALFPAFYNSAYKDTWYMQAKAPDGSSMQRQIDVGEHIDMALTITAFPQLSIVNDMYAYYLASTNYQRAYQFATADWSYNKAMAAAGLQFGQSSKAMETARNAQGIQGAYVNAMEDISQQKNKFATTSNMVGRGAGAVGNAIGSAATGNVVGVVGELAAGAAGVGMAALEGSLNAGWISATAANQNTLSYSLMQNENSQRQYNRDTNYEYAAYAAQGDYQNAIQGIQAKVQDAKMTQPTTSGQNGGMSMNMVNGLLGVMFKFKRPKREYIKQVGDYWFRYGYYVNRFITPPVGLRVMSNFSYWKMVEVSLDTDPMPEVYKETIRGILRSGVTVWSDPKKMYHIDVWDNEPLGGVSY